MYSFWTNLFVLVAIPETWDRKFKATLSPINIFLIFPSITAIRSLCLILEPSFFLILKDIFLSINLKVCLAKSNPPRKSVERMAEIGR